METTVRDITDFVVTLLDDMECAAFPSTTVLGLLGPRLDAGTSNYVRMSPTDGVVELVAPGCARNAPAVFSYSRAHPVNPWYLLMNRPEQTPTSGTATWGEAWRSHPACAYVADLTGCGELAVLPLDVSHDAVSGFSFGRARDFTASELDLLGTVQPLLRALARHADRMARWREQVADERRALAGGRDAGLTAREVDVLRLLAEGRTAGSMARRLGCAPRTAEKHAGNLYRKLGVSDRVSAVLEAQARGLLPVPRSPAGRL